MVVVVCCLNGSGRIVRRLGEMGFLPGTKVRVLRRAPLADPVEYELRGYQVSLRREEAAMVRVKRLAAGIASGTDGSDEIAADQEPMSA